MVQITCNDCGEKGHYDVSRDCSIQVQPQKDTEAYI